MSKQEEIYRDIEKTFKELVLPEWREWDKIIVYRNPLWQLEKR